MPSTPICPDCGESIRYLSVRDAERFLVDRNFKILCDPCKTLQDRFDRSDDY